MAQTKAETDESNVEDLAAENADSSGAEVEAAAEPVVAEDGPQSEVSDETAAEQVVAQEETQSEIEIEATAVQPAAEKAPVASANALSRPPVIDIAALLQPISAESPSGEYLRYSGDYDEISEARRADETLEMGAWQTDLKVADFNKVIELAVSALAQKTKDLQIAAWLCEALVARYGFAGLRDSLKLISGLINGFWPTVYPGIEDGDQAGRANALSWLDREAGFLIKSAAMTAGEGLGLSGYLDSKIFDFPDSVDTLELEQQQAISELREKAERENRVTATKWRQAVTLTNRAFCEEVKVAVDECVAQHKALNLAIEENFERNQAPGTPEIGKALSEIEELAGKLLEQKRQEEPDASDLAVSGESEADGPAGGGGVMSGAVKNRADALRKLSEIAAFFKQTEPHSPVAYLVQRAVSWGNMPLETWLQDVIKDENILYQLRQTLGFNTAPSGDSQTEDG